MYALHSRTPILNPCLETHHLDSQTHSLQYTTKPPASLLRPSPQPATSKLIHALAMHLVQGYSPRHGQDECQICQDVGYLQLPNHYKSNQSHFKTQSPIRRHSDVRAKNRS